MRLFLYATGFAAVSLVLGYFLFLQNGIDPLAPEARTIMLLLLAIAAYVGLRLAMVVRGMERRAETRADDRGGSGTGRGAFARWGRSSSLDARLDARRERLRRAREAEDDRSPSENTGDG